MMRASFIRMRLSSTIPRVCATLGWAFSRVCELPDAPAALVELEDVPAPRLETEAGDVLLAAVAIEGAHVIVARLLDRKLDALSGRDGGGQSVRAPEGVAFGGVRVHPLRGRDGLRVSHVELVDRDVGVVLDLEGHRAAPGWRAHRDQARARAAARDREDTRQGNRSKKPQHEPEGTGAATQPATERLDHSGGSWVRGARLLPSRSRIPQERRQERRIAPGRREKSGTLVRAALLGPLRPNARIRGVSRLVPGVRVQHDLP